MEEPRRFIQVVMGPRQIGKSTVVKQVLKDFEVTYWRERDAEVDFVLKKNNSIVAIEVKGNAEKRTAGLDEFKKRFDPKNAFIVGPEGVRPEDFLKMDLRRLF